MVHRKEKRIKGHLFTCVLAHLLERALAKRLKGKMCLSVAKAIQELDRIEAVKMEVDGKSYLFRTSVSKKPTRSLHMKPPARIKKL